jgi:hypothetical protein
VTVSEPKQTLLEALRQSAGGWDLQLFAPQSWPRILVRAALWLAYGCVFAVWALMLADPVRPVAPAHAKLLSLNVWTAFYYAVAILLSGAANRRLFQILERDVLPHGSDAFAQGVLEDLRRQPRRWLLRALPLSYAVLLSVLGLAALSFEIPLADWWRSGRVPADLALFAVSAAFLYYSGSAAVARTSFLLSFARGLRCDCHRLHPLAAADSPLVDGLSKLGLGALAFLAAIFAAVATIMALAFLPAPLALAQDSRFLFVIIPIAAFSSVGAGSIIFLLGEAEIRRVLRRFTLEQVQPLRRQIEERLAKPSLGEADREAIRQLDALQVRMLAGGRYGSRAAANLSLALPFVIPAISALKSIFFGK